MENKRQNYASDLTDLQLKQITPLLKGLKPGTWPKRELLNAVFYVSENGKNGKIYQWLPSMEDSIFFFSVEPG